MRFHGRIIGILAALVFFGLLSETAIVNSAGPPEIKVPPIEEIKDYIKNLGDEDFVRNAKNRKAALFHKLDAVNKKIIYNEWEDAVNKINNDILAKMDGCFSGNEKNDWIRDCEAQAQLGNMLDTLVEYLENPIFTQCENRDQLTPLLTKALGESIGAFSLRNFNPERFAERVKKQGLIDLPLTDSQGVIFTSFVSVIPELFRSTNTVMGYFKAENNFGELLGPERSWRLGCLAGSDTCSTLNFLDDNDSEPEGLVVNFTTGFSFFEPVDRLLSSINGQKSSIEPSCNIFYNVEDVEIPIEFDDDGLTPELPPNNGEPFFTDTLEESTLVYTIPIVLDSDAQFYQLDPATVWRRQASIIANVNLIYHLIEPLSSGKFDIRFEIVGQETWVSGYGPNTTDLYELDDEINHPDYFMVTHPENDQVSYFFVGYDMAGGIGGVAGGLCGVEEIDSRTGLTWDRTFGSDFEHQWNHAWGQQVPDDDAGYEFSTLYGRVVVAAHEIGHMLGALHSRGDNDVCAAPTGGWSRICGTSLMLSGGAGGVAPDFRQPFFTDANDDGIVNCVGRVAGP